MGNLGQMRRPYNPMYRRGLAIVNSHMIIESIDRACDARLRSFLCKA